MRLWLLSSVIIHNVVLEKFQLTLELQDTQDEEYNGQMCS